MNVLHVEVVLHPEHDGLAGRLLQRLHQADQHPVAEHAGLNPGAQHGDPHGRAVSAALEVVREIIEGEQALEQGQGAGGRVAQRQGDLGERLRALDAIEMLQNLDHPARRLDSCALRLGRDVRAQGHEGRTALQFFTSMKRMIRSVRPPTGR